MGADMSPLIFTPTKNLKIYLNDCDNLTRMAITKKTVSKKIISVRPAPHQTSQTSPGHSAWTTIAKLAIAFAAFFIPLAAGNWTPDRWEIHKSVVLMSMVTIAWLAYFLGQFRRPVAAWKWHPLDWLVIALGLAATIGTLTSVDWWTSLTGLQGSYSETLPVTLSFISIYVLSARLFRTSADRMIVWAALLTGIGIALLMQLFQLSGISFFSGALAEDKLFSPLANSSLQVALLAATVATIGLLLWSKAKELWAKVCLIALVTLGWIILLFMSQAIGWAAFALGMIVVVISQASRPNSSSQVVMVAVALAALGMIGQFMNVVQYADVPPTAEYTLSQSASAGTAFSAVTHRPVLGTGPSTWYNAFVQYRPESFNNDAKWGSRYLRSGAEWSQLLATHGVVGLAVWIGILLMAGLELWRRFTKGYSFTALAGVYIVALLAVSAALTTWSFSLLALGWFALGLGRAKLAESDRLPAGTKSALPAVGFALAVILSIIVWYPAVNIYASQVMSARAQKQITALAKNEDIIRTLERAVKLDKHNLDASILLANAYAVKIQQDLQANDVPTAQKDLALATMTIRTAVKNNSNNPVSYEAENNILNGLASYLPNPEEQANTNFAALRKLEPTNPIHDVGFGQTLQVIRARAAANKEAVTSQEKLDGYLAQAITAYNEALRKKPDYLQARYARADAYMAGSQYALALEDLNELTTTSPTIAVFWTAKGAVLGKLDKLELATAAFEQSITLEPSDSNVYLSYSQTLVDAKKVAEAKAVLDRGLEAIPSDADITAALTKLTTLDKK